MKNLLLVLIFLFSLSGWVVGQNTNNIIDGNITINAQIVEAIQITTVRSMSFGKVQPGQKQLYVNPVISENAGFLIARGTPNSEFRLTYLKRRQIFQIDGPGVMTFTYEISGNNKEEQTTSELLVDDNQNFRFTQTGEYFFWIGGRINLENARPGSYAGNFTIEIDYI